MTDKKSFFHVNDPLRTMSLKSKLVVLFKYIILYFAIMILFWILSGPKCLDGVLRYRELGVKLCNPRLV